MALEYGLVTGKAEHLKSRINPSHLQLTRDEYMALLKEIKEKTRARDYMVIFLLSKLTGIHYNLARSYSRGKYFSMPGIHAAALKRFRDTNRLYIFNMKPKNRNDPEYHRFIRTYKGDAVIVDYEGSIGSIDWKLLDTVLLMAARRNGTAFFYSQHIDAKRIPNFSDYRSLSAEMLHKD
ncbi:hypothetical protein HYX05_03890 [Candidatus Woesearchaeota archaeon]|nr:hypothetical protein [Candidatus Woesearchaeota archaeon]